MSDVQYVGLRAWLPDEAPSFYGLDRDTIPAGVRILVDTSMGSLQGWVGTREPTICEEPCDGLTEPSFSGEMSSPWGRGALFSDRMNMCAALGSQLAARRPPVCGML